MANVHNAKNEPLVAQHPIEFTHPKTLKPVRLQPGDPIPDSMTEADIAELTKWGSIGTELDLHKAQQAGERRDQKAYLEAMAASLGMKVVPAEE